MEIFTNFSHAGQQVCSDEKLHCYSDLPFQKGRRQCYHNAVDDYKLKVLHYLLYRNQGSSLSSAMALSRFRLAKSADEEAKLVESHGAVPKSTRYKNKWTYGIFEQ